MNAHPRSNEINWDIGSILTLASKRDARTLELIARLARVVLDPFSIIENPSEHLPPLLGPSIDRMAQHLAFSRPIRRALATSLGLDSIGPMDGLVERLPDRSASRLSVLLVTEPAETIRSAALNAAAAILHKRIVVLLFKHDRERIRAAFGSAGFRLATQESPLLYQGLAEIDRDEDGERVLEQSSPEETKSCALAVGLAALRRFLYSCESVLLPIFDLRWAPPDGGISSPAPALAEHQCKQLVKLLGRGARTWPAIIG